MIGHPLLVKEKLLSTRHTFSFMQTLRLLHGGHKNRLNHAVVNM